MGEVITAEEVKASTEKVSVESDKAKEKSETKDSVDHKAVSVEKAIGIEVNSEPETDDNSKDDSSPEKQPEQKPKLSNPSLIDKGSLSVAQTPKVKDYKLPGSLALDEAEESEVPAEPREKLLANAKLLKDTLLQFRIEVTEGDITKGPTITRYEIHPAPGVKLEKLTA